MSRIINRGLVYSFLLFWLAVTVVPLLIIWSSAFKSNEEIAASPFTPPSSITMENFEDAWTVGNFGIYARNSLIIATTTAVLVVFSSSLAAYSLTTLKVPGSPKITLFFLLGMAIPLHGIIIPQFVLMQGLGLINNLLAVIILLAALNIPFGIYLMRTYFIGMPQDLVDSAMIDGCNEFQVLWYILLPLARPALSSLAVFVFMWSWNDLILPLIYLTENDLRTVSVGLTFYQGQFTIDYAMTAAGTTIATIPVIIVYFLFQRQFVEGLTAGSIKG